MYDHENHDERAAAALARIDGGARHLLTLARQRIADVLYALDDGDFMAAHEALDRVRATVAPLANAQRSIAVADAADLLHLSDLEVGMEIVDVGTVDSVNVEQCGVARCPGHVTLKIGEHEMTFRGDQEAYVKREAE